jgi:hypothetical protein
MQKITMKTLAAGPHGTFEEGRTYPVGPRLSPELAAQFVDGGYAVPGDDETVAPPAAEQDGDKPLEKRTVEQLRAYAAAKEIDLGDASKKAEILDAITTELERREAEADDERDGDQGDGGPGA